MDIRPNGVGRLTRVVICGLLAATAFPASALADGLVGGTPVTVPSVPVVPSVPAVPAVSVPSVSVPQTHVAATAAVASAPKVSTSVASTSARVSASTFVTVRTHRATARHSSSKARAAHRRSAAKPTVASIAAGARVLASSSTSADAFTLDNPFPIVDNCTGEVTPSTGLIHIVMQTQADGTYKFFFSAQGSGVVPMTNVKLTLSDEYHEVDSTTPVADDYRKVIRQGETGEILNTPVDDDLFVHTHVEGMNTYITPECR